MSADNIVILMPFFALIGAAIVAALRSAWIRVVEEEAKA